MKCRVKGMLAAILMGSCLFIARAEDRPASDISTMSVVEAQTVIERVYLEILHRYPDEGGLDTFTAKLVDEGKEEDWLRQALLNSPEGQKIARGERKRKMGIAALMLIPVAGLLVMFIRRRSARDFLFKVALLVLASAVACLLMEGILRAQAHINAQRNSRAWRNLERVVIPAPNASVTLQNIIHVSPDPKIIYELIPGLSVRFMGGKLKTGPDGFRVTPDSVGGPSSFCILGLGDSVMFGWGVNDEDTYLSFLCRRLKAERPNFPTKAINMAVPGYNTVMEVETLKARGLRYQPGLVIIHFVENDLGLPNFICRENPNTRLSKSYLLAALSQLSGGHLATAPFAGLVRSTDEVPKQYECMVGEGAFREAMKELGALSRQHGIKVLLLTNWKAPPFVSDAAREANISVMELGPVITEYCRAQGIREYQGSVLTVGPHDPHYSALTHELVGAAILDFLKEHSLLPAPK